MPPSTLHITPAWRIAIAFALQATRFGFDSRLGLDAFYKIVMLRVKAS